MKNTPIIFFLMLLILISICFFYLISPFFVAIFLAFILAHFFRKPYEYFLKKLQKRVAALLTLLIITVSVVAPIITALSLISLETRKNYSTVENLIMKNFDDLDQKLKNNQLILILKQNQVTGPILVDYFSEENLSSIKQDVLNFLKDSVNFIFTLLKKVFLDITYIMINFLIMLYLLYFLLQEGKIFTDYLKSFIPFKNEEKEEFINESIRVIDATIIGTILIGLIEGIWGGVIFYLLDITSPATWGLIMCVLSMLPVLGTNSILAPVAIFELLTGDYYSGTLVLLIGCGGILVNQNIIKPKMVGDRSGVHPAILILSSLGGISLLGIIGFIVGPTIAVLFIVLWKQFRDKFPTLKVMV